MVGWIEVCKGDIVLSVHDEAANVEGSKLHPSVTVGSIVPGPT